MINMAYKQYDCIDFCVEPGLSVTITEPDGSSRTLEPFTHQPITISYDVEGLEHISPEGATEERIRFYPEQIGEYLLKIGEKAYPFTVEKGELPGFVTVSKKDARYFSFTDGSLFLPVGINLALLRPIPLSDGSEFGLSGESQYLGIRQFERWFKACAANGVNMVRIWLGHDYLSPDTEEADVFRREQFSKIDALVNLAEKYNLYLKLTIDQFRYFDYDETNVSRHVFKKKLYIQGKRCENSTEWLQNKEWQNAWLAKVNELAKRYSGNPRIFMIELWNEMNCVGEMDDLNAWNRKILPAVKRLFPKHLVTNSFGSLDSEYTRNRYDSFCWDQCDVMQMHRYLDQGAEYTTCNDSPLRFIPEGMNMLDKGDKPFLVAETGAVNNCHSGPFKYYACDHRGILFCDCVYTPLFCGSAGCGHIWHWDANYVESKNLYSYFKPFVNLIQDIDFEEEHFQPEVYEDEEIILFILRGKTCCLAYCRNLADNWQRVLRDLEDDKPIREKSISISLPETVEKIDIWEGESATCAYENKSLQIKDLKYGFFLKCK